MRTTLLKLFLGFFLLLGSMFGIPITTQDLEKFTPQNRPAAVAVQKRTKRKR